MPSSLTLNPATQMFLQRELVAPLFALCPLRLAGGSVRSLRSRTGASRTLCSTEPAKASAGEAKVRKDTLAPAGLA